MSKVSAPAYSRPKLISGPAIASFGKDRETLIVLLGGSAKKDQADAVARAIDAWVAYKASKRLLRKR
jgi:hypothetical protein